MYKYSEDMLLILLLSQMMENIGYNFYGENGESLTLETIQEILEDEKIKDNFYEVIGNYLTEEIEKYLDIQPTKTKSNKVIKLYK